MDGTDGQLLEAHRRGSREAFAELVRRHVNWVHSAARRRMGDEHAAEDVTQCVFEVLARKGPRLKEGEALSPWLHGVLNLTCRQGLRTELRRRKRERAAATMRGETNPMESEQWEELIPHLDDLVGRLAGVLVALLVTAGGYYVATNKAPGSSGDRADVVSSAPPTTARAQAVELSRLYGLEPGSILKNVTPPFPPGRDHFIWAEVMGNRDRPRPQQLPPETVFLQWAGGVDGWVATMSKVTLADVLRSAIRLQPYNFQGPPELLSEEMPGDWVVRTQATDAERLAALSDLLATSRGLRLHFENRPTEQEVVVVTGQYAFKRMEGMKDDNLHVFAEKMDRTEGIVRSDPVDRLFNTMAREMRMRFVNKIEGSVPDRIMWVWYDSSRMAIISKSSLERDQRLQKMFEAMGAQTGLKFTRTLQTWDVWHVEKQP